MVNIRPSLDDMIDDRSQSPWTSISLYVIWKNKDISSFGFSISIQHNKIEDECTTVAIIILSCFGWTLEYDASISSSGFHGQLSKSLPYPSSEWCISFAFLVAWGHERCCCGFSENGFRVKTNWVIQYGLKLRHSGLLYVKMEAWVIEGLFPWWVVHLICGRFVTVRRLCS